MWDITLKNIDSKTCKFLKKIMTNYWAFNHINWKEHFNISLNIINNSKHKSWTLSFNKKQRLCVKDCASDEKINSLNAKVPSYRNQSIDLPSKSIDEFLNDDNFGA